VIDPAFAAENECIISLTQTSCRLNQCVEYRFPIERREADDLEHIGGSRLLLQGLAEIGCALTQFIEQPDVLDRDRRLVCKVGNQFDLLIGEGVSRF
jgi:hypothetical protein